MNKSIWFKLVTATIERMRPFYPAGGGSRPYFLEVTCTLLYRLGANIIIAPWCVNLNYEK